MRIIYDDLKTYDLVEAATEVLGTDIIIMCICGSEWCYEYMANFAVTVSHFVRTE